MALETVTYRRMTPASSTPASTVTGVLALRRAEGTVMAGELVIRTLRWHLQASTLPDGFRCRVEDQLLDADGAKWVIKAHKLCALGTRWQLETQEQA